MSQESLACPRQQPLLDALSTEHLHADLKGRSVRGGMLTLTSQGAQFIIQSVATVVLARLLTPADFGLVAMVTAITGLGQAFADLGLSEATIQRQEISHDQVSTLFWINVAIGLGLMLVTIGSGAGAGVVLSGTTAYKTSRSSCLSRFSSADSGCSTMRFSSARCGLCPWLFGMWPPMLSRSRLPSSGLARSRLLGDRGPPPDIEFHSHGAFLADGQVDTGPAPARR